MITTTNTEDHDLQGWVSKWATGRLEKLLETSRRYLRGEEADRIADAIEAELVRRVKL